MRLGAFPARDDDLDAGGLKGPTVAPPRAAAWLTSPARAARRTAAVLAVEAQVDEALRDIDHAAWAGRSFAEIQASDPAGLTAWIRDPAAGTPGGERLDDVRQRLAPWLAARAQGSSPLVAITHPMVIRAAIATALDLPAPATLRIDIAPLSAVTLSFNGVWRLQAIRPDKRDPG
ncbi:histidine phosphatase family protein [Phenylobacterium sp. LjRoot219]|uniref:histidine phosphatase family protein n=1 Tax=Phenylobacterium sp. LjRoot219 TaxID=3342283 RepID=UPI003ECF6F0B